MTSKSQYHLLYLQILTLHRRGDEEERIINISGILGIINLEGGPYLLVVLAHSFVCSFGDCEIERVENIAIFSIRPHVTMSPSVVHFKRPGSSFPHGH